MQIAQTRADMLAVVDVLRHQLAGVANTKRAEDRIAHARRKIERIRKGFKRRIDQRARNKAGEALFAIHEREGIERDLAEATREALAAIEALTQERTRTQR
jgi:hypothetical protein